MMLNLKLKIREKKLSYFIPLTKISTGFSQEYFSISFIFRLYYVFLTCPPPRTYFFLIAVELFAFPQKNEVPFEKDIRPFNCQLENGIVR